MSLVEAIKEHTASSLFLLLFEYNIFHFIYFITMKHKRRCDPSTTRTLISRPVVGSNLALTLWTVNTSLKILNKALQPLHGFNKMRRTGIVFGSQGSKQRIKRLVGFYRF